MISSSTLTKTGINTGMKSSLKSLLSTSEKKFKLKKIGKGIGINRIRSNHLNDYILNLIESYFFLLFVTFMLALKRQ